MFRNASANKTLVFISNVLRGIFFPFYLMLRLIENIGIGLKNGDSDYVIPCTIVTVFISIVCLIMFLVTDSDGSSKTKEIWIPLGKFQTEEPIFVDRDNAYDYYYVDIEGYGKFKVRNNNFVNASFTVGTNAYVMREYWANEDSTEEYLGNTFLCQEGGRCINIDDVDFGPETYATLKKMEIKTNVPK